MGSANNLTDVCLNIVRSALTSKSILPFLLFFLPCRIFSILTGEGMNPMLWSCEITLPIHQSSSNFSRIWIKSSNSKFTAWNVNESKVHEIGSYENYILVPFQRWEHHHQYFPCKKLKFSQWIKLVWFCILRVFSAQTFPARPSTPKIAIFRNLSHNLKCMLWCFVW